MQDIIRVLRVLEYIGPRSLVEETVSRSITFKEFGPESQRQQIRGTTLGEFPVTVATAEQLASERNDARRQTKIDIANMLHKAGYTDLADVVLKGIDA